MQTTRWINIFNEMFSAVLLPLLTYTATAAINLRYFFVLQWNHPRWWCLLWKAILPGTVHRPAYKLVCLNFIVYDAYVKCVSHFFFIFFQLSCLRQTNAGISGWPWKCNGIYMTLQWHRVDRCVAGSFFPSNSTLLYIFSISIFFS